MSVGDRIKDLRETKNLSQNKLSKLAGISQSALSYIENNAQAPNIETLGMLANALNVNLSYILGEEENKPSFNPLPPKLDALLKVASLLTAEKLNTLIETAKAMM